MLEEEKYYKINSRKYFKQEMLEFYFLFSSSHYMASDKFHESEPLGNMTQHGFASLRQQPFESSLLLHVETGDTDPQLG